MMEQVIMDLPLMHLNKNKIKIVFAFSLILFTAALHPLHATTIRTEANGGLDTGSYSQQGTLGNWLSRGTGTLSNSINLLGQDTSSIYIHPQGYLSKSNSNLYQNIDHTVSTNNTIKMLAAYKGDWDTSGAGAAIYYGTATINGRPAFIANWETINGYNNTSATGSFQIALIHREDISSGDFDVEFNYGSINLASSFGSTLANAFIGYASGGGDTNAEKVTGSNQNGKFRNSDTTPINQHRNTDTSTALTGRIVMESRSGVIVLPTLTTDAYTLPAVITLNITAQNTADVFSLGGVGLSNTELLIQANPYTPLIDENFTYRLVNPSQNIGQFSDITLPSLGNGLGWDLSDLYTAGTFRVIKAPDRLTEFKPYVWLDASDPGTLISEDDDIKQWIDKSGNNRHLYQTAELLRPTKVDSVINSKPILRFDGSTYMDFQSQLFTGASARTIIAIIKKSIGDTNIPIYSETSAATPQFFELRSDRLQYGAASSVDFTTELLSQSKFKVIIASIGTGDDIGNIQVYEKGIPRNILSTTSALNTSTSGVSGIARDSGSTEFFSGDIAELLIYDRKLKPWEIDAITKYYSQKYQIETSTSRKHPSIF